MTLEITRKCEQEVRCPIRTLAVVGGKTVAEGGTQGRPCVTCTGWAPILSRSFQLTIKVLIGAGLSRACRAGRRAGQGQDAHSGQRELAVCRRSNGTGLSTISSLDQDPR